MMKNKLSFLMLFLSVAFYAQSSITIDSRKGFKTKGFCLKLKSVFDDSRCPEGVTCIWAGEVSVVVTVRKDNKLVEEKSLTFNSENRAENMKWFAKYLGQSSKSLGVFPYPKEGKTTKLKQQYIVVVLDN